MPLPVYHLRRWLLVMAALFIAMIAGVYFYARVKQRNVLKEVPNKLGIEIKQTANGFQFSKSDGKRTQFTVQAGSVKQFKLDGSAELRNVSIILYGRDSSRFDRISGDAFSYDKKTGDVIGRGDVQIDLHANPSGQSSPDLSAPERLKNPIHLKTRDLVFNQNSGDAYTDARVDFTTPQATGWAVGAHYAGKNNTLTIVSQIHVTLTGPDAATILATHGVFTREPHEIVLEHARMERSAGVVQAEEATFFLGPDNNVERVLGTGNVSAETAASDSGNTRARADQGEMFLAGRQNLLRTATLTGHVHIERDGPQAMAGDAGSAVLDFAGRNEIRKIHAADGVHLAQHAAASAGKKDSASQPQDFDITAPVIDFFLADGRRLDHAVTSGDAKIAILPAQNSTGESGQRTVVTAGSFLARFVETENGQSRLESMHGAPDAKIVNSAPGIPDRVSTSQTVDASFLPQGGIASIIQQGNVVFTDNQTPEKRTQAWADKALYTPSDRLLVLTGKPRVLNGSMLTTAKIVRINRETDDAFAEGEVKSTYSDLKPQSDGALLASSSPIHVTAASMTAHNSPAIAVYQGNARLWQDANIIEAPTIQFDRDHRSLIAQGGPAQPVSTVLVQAKPGNSSDPGTAAPSPGKKNRAAGNSEEKRSDTDPITITSERLTYSDNDRIAHYEGSVAAKGAAFTASSKSMDVYLVPRSQTAEKQSVAGAGRIDHMVAQGNVVIVQPRRRAVGDKLVYTASEDKFVLTGGPPSIFDAERGKITGVSLTFFRSDDRVLVEGEASTPVVTQTRVAR